ncbi:MAG: heparan-alpha-glucosaminide N-acetyltransferase [Atopobiaceae bacterium]
MSETQRLRLFDIIRGFSVISMMGFHACYDLTAIFGVRLLWFAPPFEDIWRDSISWTFLFIAGVMCSFSRSNLKRSGRYLALALAIWLVTTVAAVDTAINFGIIFCMGACTLIYALLQKAGFVPDGWKAAIILLAAFFIFYGLPRGSLGFSPLSTPLPKALYQVHGLAWLGIPGPGFASGDYYPVLPYLFMYLSGASLGKLWKRLGYPGSVLRIGCPPLEFVGRHPLAFYVLHQPAIIFICMAVTGIDIF